MTVWLFHPDPQWLEAASTRAPVSPPVRMDPGDRVLIVNGLESEQLIDSDGKVIAELTLLPEVVAETTVERCELVWDKSKATTVFDRMDLLWSVTFAPLVLCEPRTELCEHGDCRSGCEGAFVPVPSLPAGEARQL